MKFRCFISGVLAGTTFLVFQVSDTKPVVAAQTKPLKSAVLPKVPSQSQWDALVREARKEGKVVIYGSATGDTSGALIKAFRDRYGIGLEFLQGRGGEIIERLLSERRAGLYSADVGVGGPTTFFSVIVPHNLPVPLDTLIVSDEVKDPTKWRTGGIPYADDKKKIIAPVAAAIPCVVINKEMVKDGEFYSYNDLLNPKWKGKIALNDPTTSGMGLQWFGFMILQAYGREKGIDFMKKFALQHPAIVRDERLQVEWIAKGKYPVAIGAKPTIVQSFIAMGANLGFVFMKEGAPLNPGPLMIYAFDRAPHPSATKLFINWFLSKEAGEIFAKTSGYPSERTDVSKEGFDPAILPGPKEVLGGKLGLAAYEVARSQLTPVAADIFKDLLQ